MLQYEQTQTTCRRCVLPHLTQLTHREHTSNTQLTHSLGFRCVTGWRRPVGSLIFIGHFSQKSPIISESFAESDLQVTGILWVFATLYLCVTGGHVTHCNTLQHTATHCNTLQHTESSVSPVLWRRQIQCVTLQHTAPHCNLPVVSRKSFCLSTWLLVASSHCNTVQRTATHRTTLQLACCQQKDLSAESVSASLRGF